MSDQASAPINDRAGYYRQKAATAWRASRTAENPAMREQLQRIAHGWHALVMHAELEISSLRRHGSSAQTLD
jgi:hypothetical protein